MVEANLVDEGKTITAEEYYDDPNNRAVVKLMQNDQQDFILLDYTANQIVYIVSKYWYLGVSCYKRLICPNI